jgi:hypothetical protein
MTSMYGNGGEEPVVGTFSAVELESRDDHHVGWNKAMKNALEKIPDTWHGKTLRVTQSVTITPNPGSVGEYLIALQP